MHRQALLGFSRLHEDVGQALPSGWLSPFPGRAASLIGGLSILSPISCAHGCRAQGPSLQQAVDLAGNEPFEAAQDLSLALSLGRSPLGISLGGRIPAQPIQSNAEQRAVGLTVPAAVEPVALASA